MPRENELDREITAWIEDLPEPTPEEIALSRETVDKMLEAMLGRPPRNSAQRAEEVNTQKGRDETYAREDVQAVHAEITREVDRGSLSVSALTAYRIHLLTNHYGPPPSSEVVGKSLEATGIDSGIRSQTHIDTHEQLGPNVDSILFTGANSHSIALARRRLSTPEAIQTAISSNLDELQRAVSETQGKVGFGYKVNRQPKS